MILLTRIKKGKRSVELVTIEGTGYLSDFVHAALKHGLDVGLFKSWGDISRLRKQKGIKIDFYAKSL